jgi:hypothetical protein
LHRILLKQTGILHLFFDVRKINKTKGYTTNIAYEATDRVQQITQPVTVDGVVKQLVTKYGYTQNNDAFTTLVTDPKGIVTQYQTNGNGNVTEIIEDFGTASSNQNIKTSFTWDQQNRLTKEVDPRLQSTIFSYGVNGNLEKVNNPKNHSQTVKYDQSNNMEQYTGFGGQTEKFHYDSNSNSTAELNTLAGTSVNEDNSAGQIVRTTAPISVGDNIVVNNGFEYWGTSAPTDWTSIGGGSILKSTLYVNGNYSLGMDSTGSADIAKMASRKLPVQGNTMYSVSWFVRAYDSIADVKVEWYSGTTLLQTTSSLGEVSGRTSWMRQGSRTISPGGADSARLILSGEGGRSRFDNVQLEEGTYVNDVNFLVNEGFENDLDVDGKPDEWSLQSISSGDGMDLTKAYTGKSSVLLNGAGSVNKYFGQNIQVPGDAGTTLTFSGWSYATGVSSTGGDYVLLLRVDYKVGTTGWFSEPFTKSDHTSWEYQVRSLTISKEFKSLGLFVKYDNQTGKAWFDELKLHTVGISNAMMSEYNIAQNGSFEYDLDGTNHPDGWKKYVESNTTATMNWEWGWDTSYIGEYAVSVANTGGWAVYGNLQNEPLRSGKTYAASAMIKPKGVTAGGRCAEA